MGLGAMLAACGERGEAEFPRTGTVQFRFAPPDGTAYVETTFTRVRQRSGSRLRGWYETEHKSDVTIRQSGADYLLTSKGLAARSWLNGSGYNDPRIAAFVGHELTRHIDPDGKLAAVDGLREFVARMRATVPAEIASQLGYTERAMLEEIREHWKRRVTDLAGTTLSIGQPVETAHPVRLPDGAEISLPRTTSLLHFSSCPAGRCVLLLEETDSDDPALEAYVRAAMRGDLIFWAEGERAKAIGPRVTGSSSRLIDPDTMRVYQEDGSEAASFTMNLPGRGEILFERTSETRRTFEYH